MGLGQYVFSAFFHPDRFLEAAAQRATPPRAALRRAPSGEIASITFSRDAVRITSYESDAIHNTVKTRADTVPTLA